MTVVVLWPVVYGTVFFCWHHCRENAQVTQGGRHLLGGPQACIHCDKSVGRREVHCRALGELGLRRVPDVTIFLQYQSNMRGVDIVDQKVSMYTMQLQSHKRWHRILLDVTDLTLTNSWTLHAADCYRLGLPMLARQLFHKKLALALIAPSVRVARVP